MRGRPAVFANDSAALGGSVVLGERLGTRGVLGCVLIFAGMIAAQLPVIARGAVRGRPAL